MNIKNRVSRGFCFLVAGFLCKFTVCSAAPLRTNEVGFETNGPAVLKVSAIAHEQIYTNVLKAVLLTNNGIRSIERTYGPRTNTTWITNRTFDHFRPDSFSNYIWTNVIAHTNGRTTQLWSERRHPPGWPKSKPVVKWDHNSLVYGMRGFTALSPCWESEVSSGQLPITALTRRHGYTRGHGMGPSGFGTRFSGKKAWFVSADDRVVEVKVLGEVVRTQQTDHRDYTILLFDRDLPDSIQPLRSLAPGILQTIYPAVIGAPRPFFLTEQGGRVSAEIPGLFVPIWKGGDSGSPNMLPLGNELVFCAGRSTSPPSAEMQADMDQLCRLNQLEPARYRLDWVEFRPH